MSSIRCYLPTPRRTERSFFRQPSQSQIPARPHKNSQQSILGTFKRSEEHRLSANSLDGDEPGSPRGNFEGDSAFLEEPMEDEKKSKSEVLEGKVKARRGRAKARGWIRGGGEELGREERPGKTEKGSVDVEGQTRRAEQGGFVRDLSFRVRF
eukprot:CAMPEP_0174892778 /NCGR_PEP_ID=MMETSP0167-20121228/7679_1 /TAXON_ID=38298 /ORGANISM="Rhodella maculata, Strain CCMP736" /LENGTH=152 /DNA_ID=CAMNT_0016131379 /DNA_START=69 /DNA_END=527 /DNA_ORIENTATION=-